MALATLALGMGATTAIFSIVDAVLLKPLPFRDPGRLLVIWEKNAAQNRTRMFVPPANYREWQRQSASLESLAAIESMHVNLTAGPNGRMEPEELRGERVTASLFPLLGVQPIVGRGFRPEEDRPGHAGYVLLSHGLWTRRFGADRSIPGKAIQLGNRSYTVLGVLPAGFAVVQPGVDIWLPLALDAADAAASSGRTLMVVARLKPGVAVEKATSELDAIGGGLEQANPVLNSGWRPSVYPLQEEVVGKVHDPLMVLMAAVGFLLLMGCANVANLLLARAGSRRREVAIRTAMGAGRGTIVLQLLGENMVLAAAGGALGLLLARGGIALLEWLGPANIPRLADARVDARLFLFALVSAAVTGPAGGDRPRHPDFVRKPQCGAHGDGARRNHEPLREGRPEPAGGGRGRAGGGRADRRRIADAQLRSFAFGQPGISAVRTAHRASAAGRRQECGGAAPGGVYRPPSATGIRASGGSRRGSGEFAAALRLRRRVFVCSVRPSGAAARSASHRTDARRHGLLLPDDGYPAGGRPRVQHRRYRPVAAGHHRQPDPGAPLLAGDEQSGRRPGREIGARPA